MKIEVVESLSEALRTANGPMKVLDHNVPDFLQDEGAEAKRITTDEGILLESVIWVDDLYELEMALLPYNWELHSTTKATLVRTDCGYEGKIMRVRFKPLVDVEDDFEDCDCDICEAAEVMEKTSIDFTRN